MANIDEITKGGQPATAFGVTATPATGPLSTRYDEPGARLPNGAIIVAARTAGRGTVVLALTNGMAAHPYVTWVIDPETGHAWTGDYCMTFEGAMRSYARRSGFLVETLGSSTY